MPSTKHTKRKPGGVTTRRDEERIAVLAAIRRANQREAEIRKQATRLERLVRSNDGPLEELRLTLEARAQRLHAPLADQV